MLRPFQMVYQYITVPPSNIIAAQANDATNIYRTRNSLLHVRTGDEFCPPVTGVETVSYTQKRNGRKTNSPLIRKNQGAVYARYSPEIHAFGT